MKRQLIGVSFEPGEFEEHFPEIAKRDDLNNSDKIRLALGLQPRRAKAGPPKGNKNAIGNSGRWRSGGKDTPKQVKISTRKAIN